MFLLVFTVFMLAYSISVQSLSHPNRAPFWGIIWDVFQQGIWETFGEPQEEAMKGSAISLDVILGKLSTFAHASISRT
jgi:hypothetical protein